MPNRRLNGSHGGAPVIGMLLMMLAACATEPSSAPAVPAPNEPEPALTSQCRLLPIADLIGQVADATLLEQARIDSGSARVRVIGPGQMVTQDFQSKRLNVYVDEHNVITKLGCG